jgi:prepilin signal peptidase PulO-like enzyme (type II secretory pathway)
MDFILFLIYLFIFILGLCVGSFLNCVIYRLETGKSLKGRSFCPKCKKQLKWTDLIPVFSFLFLCGKCKYCKEKISLQYPIVEISTATIFLMVFNIIPNLIGNPEYYHLIPAFAVMTEWIMVMAFYFYIASVMIVIFVYDLKHYEIPDKILIPAIIATAIYDIFILCQPFSLICSINYIFAALIGSGFFLSIFLISKGLWMGFGDVKFAILMGLLLGFPNILLALFLSFFFGAIIGIILMVFKKKGIKSEIPFAPFLIIGTFLTVFWGEQIMSWYLSLIYF